MEISWWTRPGVRELRYLAPPWGDSVCRSLPRMDERAWAKLTAKRAKTTATQLFPTRSPTRPREQADERSRIRSRWGLEQEWNLHEIHFIPSVTCGMICYRADSPAGAYRCPVSNFSRLWKGSEAPKLASKLETWNVSLLAHSLQSWPLQCKDHHCPWKHLIEGCSLNCNIWFKLK